MTRSPAFSFCTGSCKLSQQSCLLVLVQFPDQKGLTVPCTVEQATISSFHDFLCPGNVLCLSILYFVAYKKSETARQSHSSQHLQGAGEGHTPAGSEKTHFWGRTVSPGCWQFRVVSLMTPAPLGIQCLTRLGASNPCLHFLHQGPAVS